MKLLVGLIIFCISFISQASSSNLDCKEVNINGINSQVCFPVNHVCEDLHGNGNGTPIQINCFTEGTRLCHNGNENWPQCAGGFIANTCKKVLLNSTYESVCFPIGHTCVDPHGVGDGVPVKIDCFNGGTRSCHSGLKVWPSCAGGKII